MTDLTRKANTILLADDEPYNLDWIAEYLAQKGYRVQAVTSVDQAINELRKNRFRAVVADLSIPFRNPQPVLGKHEPLHEKYPGLVIAEYARNHWHLDRQVIVYSVHDDPAVAAHAGTIGVTYLLKGRPRQFKEEMDDVLSYDPHGQ